jgi:hypothetical protein
MGYSTDLGREFAIGPGFAVGDVAERAPDREMEFRALGREGQVEFAQIAGEVGSDLFGGAAKDRGIVGRAPGRPRQCP